MYKKLEEEQNGVKDNEIIVDFSNNKSLIKENANLLNESIINITINESKQLIEKSNNNLEVVKPSGRVFSGTDCITNRRQTDENKLIKQIKPTLETQKPIEPIPIKKEKVTLNKSMKNISNLTINNCTGTLNFKNISNLTINSCKGVNGFDSTSPKTEEYECGFYNRLISENKLLNSIPTGPPSSISSSVSTRSKLHSKDIEFKNNKLNYIPNSKSMNLINNNCNFDMENYENNHPVQVQQWLKQIYYEAETDEPVQNIEILEHSNIDIN